MACEWEGTSQHLCRVNSSFCSATWLLSSLGPWSRLFAFYISS